MEENKVFNLEGRTALVTGASGHLGKSIVRALCEAGAHVILNGTSSEKIELLENELVKSGYSVSTAVFDITDEMMLKTAARKIEVIGRLDILVNNAYSGKSGTIESSTPESFNSAYNIAVTSAFNIIKSTLPVLKKTAKLTRGGASIINIASMYGTVSPDPAIYGDSGENNPPFYGAAKAGLIQLTRYLACHLAPYNIRVNSISPGPFPRQEVISNNPVFVNKLCEKVPMKRVGHPDEIKGPVLFLASDGSSYVTGINLPVDGGWTAW
ncbi:MAG: SDR family oxidoreductase [Firmicutes bacterium]|nr:SDR family oxidoreductase [Bacillota bacterium]